MFIVLDLKNQSGIEVVRKTVAYQRRFDVAVFWSLDRFSREGVAEMLNHLQWLVAAGVQFESFTEQ